MSRRIRSFRALGAGMATAAALAACAVVLPQPNPDPVPGDPQPVLSVAQADEVLGAVGEVLAAADAAADVNVLATRADNPALTLRLAQYTLAERSGGARVPTPLTTDDQVLVIAASESWPRTIMAITTPPEGTNLPLLLVIRQEEPRGQYLLSSWVRLFPGIETPPVASPEVGSAELPPDATDLLVTPADALAQYSDFLVNGAASPYAANFAEDPLFLQLRGGLETNVATLQGIADVFFTAAPLEGYVVSLATADGGALVVGSIATVTTYTKTLEGATLTLGGEIGQWLGDGTVETSASAGYDTPVAMYVPPAGGAGVITVLGAERVLVNATKQ